MNPPIGMPDPGTLVPLTKAGSWVLEGPVGSQFWVNVLPQFGGGLIPPQPPIGSSGFWVSLGTSLEEAINASSVLMGPIMPFLVCPETILPSPDGGTTQIA